MLKLSACIEMIFRDLPFPDRIAKVAECGLPACEFWRWVDKDLDAIVKAKEAAGIAIACCSCDTRGPLVADGSAATFVEGLKASCEAAHRLGTRTLIVTTGQEIPGKPRSEQHANIVTALKEGAPIAEREGITLVLEPLNVLVNHKGYYLSTSAEGFEILREVGSPNVKLLFDIYHQQITEGNLINNIRDGIDLIGHFHVADNPGRNEPGTGEINYRNVFKAIEAAGYQGYVGLEYHPLADPAETLKNTLALARG
ncbi:MAG TPA: TIM barrel protein [Armatimonadota bacterium]|nr:TIM barrel protein [Armatimonadota bacterium]HPT96513.1 TIM barrel protein [Armatimonadota bacterium]